VCRNLLRARLKAEKIAFRKAFLRSSQSFCIVSHSLAFFWEALLPNTFEAGFNMKTVRRWIIWYRIHFTGQPIITTFAGIGLYISIKTLTQTLALGRSVYDDAVNIKEVPKLCPQPIQIPMIRIVHIVSIANQNA